MQHVRSKKPINGIPKIALEARVFEGVNFQLSDLQVRPA
jgi:hypothetical protein